MGFSKYLDSKRGEIKQLVAELKKKLKAPGTEEFAVAF